MICSKQAVTLESPGCMDPGTVAHELLHALGLFLFAFLFFPLSL